MTLQHLKNYQLLNEIGAGGMATVYRARDTRTRHFVAIKIMHPHLAKDPGYVERFQREAKTAMSLDDPHIVKVLDFGRDKGVYFLAMEFVDGVTLHQILQTWGALPISQALSIAAQVTEALECAYRHGIVHRDIKPQNLMVTKDGTIKIMDFGIARVSGLETMTQTGVFIGSPFYISPEQAEGKHVDIRSDIYSLGIVLYQLLAGVVPFKADTPWVVLRQHMETEPVLVSRLRVDVPPEAEAIVRKALAKRPEERYQTPVEMQQALYMALERLGIPRNAVSAEPTVLLADKGRQRELTPTPPPARISDEAPNPPSSSPAGPMPVSMPQHVSRPFDPRLALALALSAGGLVILLLTLALGVGGGQATPTATFAAGASPTASPLIGAPSSPAIWVSPTVSPLPTMTPTRTLTPLPPTTTPTPTSSRTPTPTHTSIPTATPTPTPSYTPVPTPVPPTPVPPTSPPPTPAPSTPTKTLPPLLPTPTKTLPPPPGRVSPLLLPLPAWEPRP